MRRSEYEALSEEKATEILKDDDYKKLVRAINKKEKVSFTYTDKNAKRKIYRAVIPKRFFFTPGWSEPPVEGAVYLWGYHLLHLRNHSFRADRIKDVDFFPTIIQALTDPGKYSYYWKGPTASIQTEKL
jgi:predicted DNA-binding transcriptional regulator YafY